MSNIEFESLDDIPEDDVEQEEEVSRIPYPTNIDTFRLESSSGRSISRAAYDRDRRTIEPGMAFNISFWDVYGTRGVQTAFQNLATWAEANNILVSSVSREEYSFEGIILNVPYWFVVGDPDDPDSKPLREYIPNIQCTCGHTNPYPSVLCLDCGRAMYCSRCREQADNQQYDAINGHYCEHCGMHCERDDCTAPNSHYHPNYTDCPTCNPQDRCFNCATTFPRGEGHELEVRSGRRRQFIACNSCWPQCCNQCGRVNSEDLVEENLCSTCAATSYNEEWEDSELENEELEIPSIPGRETIRLVGIEIEGANGEGYSGNDAGQLLATRLYDEGISSSYSMHGYHHGNGSSLVHVERDSSVDWEMVIGPLNIAESDHVNVLNRSVKVVRKMIKEDRTLKLDMRAGMHVHVGASNVSFHSAYNLHILYMHNEDFLYRIGAANWPHHRSIIRRGRDTAGKSPLTEGKLNFARTFRENRYYGLSFENYFARYFEACHCGARQYGLFDECTCELGKCTFEFRLFNTTANTIKIHAYLALCQALVAKAIELPEITDISEYPALDFEKVRFSDMNNTMKRRLGREWEKRIEFVNEQLPLTPEEKKSIYYCVNNSEIGKVVSNAEILINGGNV